MLRPSVFALVLVGLVVATPSSAQVVESTPSPARTDKSVTLTFYADRGDGGLEGHDGDVYIHTGISTSNTDEKEWKCVKNHWPTDGSFTGNRSDTKLSEVADNRYELVIDDIRAYYKNTSTSCSLADSETIQTMNMVFRDADGSKVAKAEGGDDIFVDVIDVSDGDPFLSSRLVEPDADPPFYPFMTNQDTTISVTVSADTANVDSFTDLRLFVDGSEVASTSEDNLTYNLSTGASPTRYQIQGVSRASADGETLKDTVETEIIRTPNVVEQARPSGVEDGITYYSDESKVTLSLYAPGKDFVYAIGDFTNWEIDDNYFLKRDGDHWWITIDGLQSGKEYDFQYFVDGEIRTGDPFSHKVRSPNDEDIDRDLEPYPEEQTENIVSVLQTGQQDFNFSSFERPDREDLVVYELLLRDFLNDSSFSTLIDTLDYLDRLGVNAIELMPVSNFGGNSSWGYNPNFHLAVDKSYGSKRDLKRFVEAAHQRGMAVILDVVYNHVTGQSPLVQLYGATDDNPFLNVPASVPYSVFNQLDHSSPWIHTYLDRANEYWIEEFNVDGYRFDLTKGFISGHDISDPDGYQQARVDNLQRMADHIWDEVDSDAYVIFEHLGREKEEEAFATYRENETGGIMLWHNMNRAYSQSSMGFLDSDAFSSDLTASYYQNRWSAETNPNFVTYMESHDEQWLMHRNRNFGKTTNDYSVQNLETALNRQKLVGAFFFSTPGPRMIWQFGELGYGWEEDECLKPGDGSDGECSSSAPGRVGAKPIRWEYFDSGKNPGRVRLYKTWSALLQLRNSHPTFTSTTTDVSMRVGQGEFDRRVVLQHDSMDAVVIGNFDVAEREVNPKFPQTGTWYDYFTGVEVNINSEETDAGIRLAPGEFHVFTSKAVDFPKDGLVPYDHVAPAPAPPTNLEAQIGTETIELSWKASTASDLTGYAVYRGKRAQFDTTGARIARLQKGTTSYTDANADPGTLYYYRLVALDDDGMKSGLTQNVTGVVYPKSFSFEVDRSFGSGRQQQSYRLVALPGAGERPLSETLSGEAGDTWQAYWDDGTDDDFFVQFDGSDTFRLKPGRGFWLISDSSWSVQETVSSVSLEQGNVTTIDLHSGWNIISNPFDRSVSWGEVSAENGGGLQPLWAFEGGFSIASTFTSAATGQAFYFLNDQNLDQLTIPYAARASATTEKDAGSEPATMVLEVEQEGRTASVQLGAGKGATVGVDALDWVAPPTRFAALSLRSRPEGAPSSRQQLLARNVYPPAKEGQSFALTLKASSEEPVQFRVTDADAFKGQEIRLVAEKSGRTYDLRKQDSPEFQPEDETTELTLLVGTESYVQEKQKALSVSELQLQPGYPNPFRQKTTLTYTVPESGPVKFEVFDVLGRRVRVLVDERKEAGTYEATWNGGNDAGRDVASGVYLGRLTFDGQTVTQKMVLVK